MKVLSLQALHLLCVTLAIIFTVVSAVPMVAAGLLARCDDWLGMKEILAKAEQRTAKERKA